MIPESGTPPDSGHLTLDALAAELAVITPDKTFNNSMKTQAVKPFDIEQLPL
ncbi:hypothetical protein [Photorhabdus temperata]|uniref:hypothetical protein n=1 Tax=Photorhabdus temperata TaxID=574560 RepID=UPI00041A4189|nr:hypothetical protein [Photorhabdus temperata]